MPMGMGGGFDSSGPAGLGADAFGGEERSNRIAFYMDDNLSPKKSYREQIRDLYDAYDPKGQYDHNPHLDSLEPGAYNLGQVPYGQLYDHGLITQQQYDQYNMWGNQTMPTGKNFPLHEQPGVLEHNMPGLPMEEVTPPPTFNHSLINAVPLNPPVPANMDVEELNWIDMPLPNPDLKSAPTGPGSYGWGGGGGI